MAPRNIRISVVCPQKWTAVLKGLTPQKLHIDVDDQGREKFDTSILLYIQSSTWHTSISRNFRYDTHHHYWKTNSISMSTTRAVKRSIHRYCCTSKVRCNILRCVQTFDTIPIITTEKHTRLFITLQAPRRCRRAGARNALSLYIYISIYIFDTAVRRQSDTFNMLVFLIIFPIDTEKFDTIN